MRRSVAPSLLNPSTKRARFISPLLNKTNDEDFNLKPLDEKLTANPKGNLMKTTTTLRNTSDVLRLMQFNSNVEKEENNSQDEFCHISNEKTVEIDQMPQNLDQSKKFEEPENSTLDKIGGGRFFNVVWCKLSKKKHKKWEGDAILEVKGRCVVLRDTEGKQIGQGSGYKIKDVENLESGSTLVIGGKEIEILDQINEKDYASGACFLNNVPSIPSEISTVARKKSKPKQIFSGVYHDKKPLFDPTKPDAFVLTRPNEKHQWTYNKHKLPIVDLVVDPKLSVHLRAHQKEGILFLYECIMGMRDYSGLGAILADEMGLGKTLQCICLIWTLLKQGPYGGKPVLRKVVIATPSSLVKNWVKEFEKWLGKGKIVLYAVDSRHCVKDFSKQPCCPVMIISYEMLVRHSEEIDKMNFDLIICDEGHRLKNIAGKTTSSISGLPIDRRILLTGTPVQNDLQEYFSIVDFCNPGILGTNSKFRHIFEEPIILSRQPTATAEEKEIGLERAEELSRITELFTLRRTQEVINKFLPPKVENIIFCRPSEMQICLIKSILDSSLAKYCLKNPDKAHPFACIAALKKVCNHPNLVFHQNATETNSEKSELYSNFYSHLSKNFPYSKNEIDTCYSGKMKVLFELLATTRDLCPSERFVVVSGYVKTLDILQEICVKYNYSFLRLDGSTPTVQRQEIVDQFNQTSSHYIFLLSSKAGGVGFNLIGASRMVLFDIDWNPAHDLQAMARVWRDGQKKTVHIYRLLTTGTVEEKIFQRQIIKQNLSGVVVDQCSNSKIEFTTDDLKDLFTFHQNTECYTHDQLNCSCFKNEPQPQHNENENPIRTCQIKLKTSQKSKNLNMTQLLDWNHIPSSELKENGNDNCLIPVADHITFIFQNKSNHHTSNACQ